jgi:hypothetical protein
MGGFIIMKVPQQILNYIKQQELFSIPQLQDKFSMNYYNAHKIVDELLKVKIIAFNGEINYKVITTKSSQQSAKKSSDKDLSYWDKLRQKRENEEKRRNKYNDDKENDDDEENTIAKYREYLEIRRREILKRMDAVDEDDDDDNFEDDGNADNGDVVDEDSNNEDEVDQVENVNGDLPCALITERNVIKFLYKLIKSDREMTRNGAIKRIENCICRARSKEYFNSAIFLKRVMERLVEMSDYKYKKLRQQLCGGEE